jgi:hypothetical protein
MSREKAQTEWNNGRVAKQRLNPGPYLAGSTTKTQVLVGVYQPGLHKVPEMRAGVVRE